MKYIFSLLLVFSFNISFGQMTVSEMIKIYGMDLDEFETFALGKGFELHEIKNDEKINGVVYIKNRGLYPYYLELDLLNVYHGKLVSFQTSINSEFVSIKNQLKILGFKLFNDENSFIDEKQSMIVRSYKNIKWKVIITQDKIISYGKTDTNIYRYRVDLQKLNE